MIEIIANIIMGIGFIMLLGSAGASDRNLVPFGTTVLTATISMTMILIGYIVNNKIKNK